MSQAAIRSNRGDDFQREIVLHWAVRLLSDNGIASVESETIADPVTKQVILVDDIIVRYKNGRTVYAQCKIDSIDRNGWKLSDKVLKDELVKVRDQLEQDVRTEAIFYSQTPFGEMKKLLDATIPYHSASDVLAFADGNVKKLHSEISNIIQRDDTSTFNIYKRLQAFSNALDEWSRHNNIELGFHLPNPLAARDVILTLISDHAAQRTGSPLKITRETVVNRLAERRLYLSPPYEEKLLLEEFAKASLIGRQDLSRQIAGEKLPRPELSQLIERTTCDGTTIVKGSPGNGKSWLLLEFADMVESNPLLCLLFIKGDRFTTIENEKHLSVSLGFDGTLSGMVERLAEKRRVVLVLDSLDTLSLNGNHLALQTYLSIIDRLDNRANISIICACRTFDLAYDPLLRERKWGCEITVQQLDPETVIRPFLIKLGVDCDTVPAETINLFGNPQYLKLYEAIHHGISLSEIRSVQVLQELFLREKIQKNPLLGESAMSALYAFAELLAGKRSLRCERTDFSAPETMVRNLESAGVLSGDAKTVGFAHQTFFDALWVRKARQAGMGLREFVMGRPALPFYRPAIRAYVMYLHETDPTVFVREMRQMLADFGVAYHVRKLALDTLAGMTAHDSDLALCRWLLSHDADLFRRFLWATKDESWFLLFQNNNLIEEGLFGNTTLEPQRQWLAWVGRKENRHSREKVSIWRRFLKSDDEEIRRQIMMNADDFMEWRPEDRDVVETLISWDVKGRIEHLMTGKIIRHFIEATNQGDDILWGYMRHQIMSTEGFPNPYRLAPSLDVHIYEKEDFLPQRLEVSEVLLTLALNDLLEWVALCRSQHQEWQPEYLGIYIHSTSWERLHNDYDMHPYDGFMQLLDGIEQALQKHASSRTDLWLEFAPELLASHELGLMYMVIRGCQSDPQRNVVFAELLFSEHLPLLYGNQLTHEFWELVHDVSPYLTEGILREIQSHAHEKIASAEADEKPWTIKHLYDLLSRIPSCYLISETLQFMETAAERHGPPYQERQIYGSGGWVPPPVSRENFAGLSPGNQWNLLKWINREWRSENHFSSDMRGMARVVCEEATADPTRYLALLEIFDGEQIEPEYESAIIEGCATYLRYRFGNLRPPEAWQALSEPDAMALARIVLQYCEKNRDAKIDFARNLEVCCDVLNTPEDVSLLVSLLYFAFCESPPNNSDYEVGTQALSSLRGEATSAACQLYLTLFKNDCPIPDDLNKLLFQAAANAYHPARWALLRGLPSMIRFDEDLCWRLFQTCHADHPDDLWDVSDDFIYYSYWKHPERYLTYLDRMSQHPKDDIRKSYGTLLALYFISQKIETEGFWEKIAYADASTLAGISKVFVKNVDEPDCRTLCLGGLQWLLDKVDLPNQSKTEIDRVFSKKDRQLPAFIPLKFIEHLDDDRGRLHWMLDWLGVQSKHNPEGVLEIIEVLLQRLREIERNHLWHADGLVAASINILRHADLMGDESLINRAIAVQDELIRLHVDKMETALEEAAR